MWSNVRSECKNPRPTSFLICGRILILQTSGISPYLGEVIFSNVRLGIEEVQDITGVLDSVFSRLLWGGEAVVAGSMKVFEAAGVILQLIGLSWYNSLLLGHAAGKKTTSFIIRVRSPSLCSLCLSVKCFIRCVIPNIEFLSKQEVIVEVSDGPVHRVTVSHLHHCCSRFTLHEFDLKQLHYKNKKMMYDNFC